jgi:hypothetical protein
MTRELKPEELRAICDPATLPFDSTTELPPLDGMIGQDRAVSATAFGIGMRRAGYNLFVVGAARTGRTSTMHRVLTRTAREAATPWDYCYVYNFADPYRPAALELPAGRAREIAEEMTRLVQECRTRLPRAFEGEEFERQKAHIVDRTGAQGAPVVVEPNPSHANLFGRLEHRVHFGALVGALHQANGGYLVLEATDVLRALMAWDALKKALKSRSIRLEDPLDELRLVSTVSLAPEPIPLAVKVILIGSPLLCHLLYTLDEDFRELFKVKVDFDDSLPRTPEFELLYARFVGNACREEKLPHFSREGLAKLIEHSARLVAHQGRLSAKLGDLLDVIREAAYWTGQRQGTLVSGEDVSQAIAQKTYRANLVEERVGRMISEGTLLIATDGQAVGQVNGISVLAFGDHVFGRPSRITGRTYSGEPGVVDIEREAKLCGPIHSKGVMILTGFLAGRYAHQRPLALSATIAFEQQYEEVEGDSASSAELYALLSSLTDIPLRQDLAVTGSVNQHGEIQAVGGIKLHRSEFLERIRQDAGLLTARQAEWLTVAVFSALKAQLSEGETEDVLAQLPKDLKELWVEAPRVGEDASDEAVCSQ